MTPQIVPRTTVLARALGREGLLEGPLDEVLPLALTNRGDIAVPASAPSGVNRVGLTAVGLEHLVCKGLNTTA